MEKELIYVSLEKLSDDVFNGLHPNGIYEGAKRDGILMHNVRVGQNVLLGHKLFEHIHPTFYTSVVTKILEEKDNTIKFKTQNSTYLLTYD